MIANLRRRVHSVNVGFQPVAAALLLSLLALPLAGTNCPAFSSASIGDGCSAAEPQSLSTEGASLLMVNFRSRNTWQRAHYEETIEHTEHPEFETVAQQHQSEQNQVVHSPDGIQSHLHTGSYEPQVLLQALPRKRSSSIHQQHNHLLSEFAWQSEKDRHPPLWKVGQVSNLEEIQPTSRIPRQQQSHQFSPHVQNTHRVPPSSRPVTREPRHLIQSGYHSPVWQSSDENVRLHGTDGTASVSAARHDLQSTRRPGWLDLIEMGASTFTPAISGYQMPPQLPITAVIDERLHGIRDFFEGPSQRPKKQVHDGQMHDATFPDWVATQHTRHKEDLEVSGVKPVASVYDVAGFHSVVDCEDNSKQCIWLASQGYCDSHASFMHMNCKRSCDQCQPENVQEVPPQVVATVPKTTANGPVSISPNSATAITTTGLSATISASFTTSKTITVTSSSLSPGSTLTTSGIPIGGTSTNQPSQGPSTTTVGSDRGTTVTLIPQSSTALAVTTSSFTTTRGGSNPSSTPGALASSTTDSLASSTTDGSSLASSTTGPLVSSISTTGAAVVSSSTGPPASKSSTTSGPRGESSTVSTTMTNPSLTTLTTRTSPTATTLTSNQMPKSVSSSRLSSTVTLATTTTTTIDDLQVSMVVENVDYNELNANPTLRSNFENQVKQAVVSHLQNKVSANQVQVIMTSGSVKLEVRIVPNYLRDDVASITQKLKSTDDLLRTVETRVTTVGNIDVISSGQIRVVLPAQISTTAITAVSTTVLPERTTNAASGLTTRSIQGNQNLAPVTTSNSVRSIMSETTTVTTTSLLLATIAFNLTVLHLDYAKLTRDTALLSDFESRVANSIAQTFDLKDAGRVSLKLSPGSVVVQAQFQTSSKTNGEALLSVLKARWGTIEVTLTNDLRDTIQSISGIQAATTGAISIGDIRSPAVIDHSSNRTFRSDTSSTSTAPTRSISQTRASPALASSTITTTATATATRDTEQGGGVLRFNFTVENVEFTRLAKDAALQAEFIKHMKTVIAREFGSGIGINDVDLSLFPGSVIVQVAIAISRDLNRTTLQLRWSADWQTFNKTLIDALTKSISDDSGIQTISSGTIRVTTLSFPYFVSVLTSGTTTLHVAASGSSALEFSFAVQNISYVNLTQNATIETSFRQSINNAIASAMDGVDPGMISLSLSPGSVIVQARVSIPRGRDPLSMRLQLIMRMGSFSRSLVESVAAAPGIERVTSGAISVSDRSSPKIVSMLASTTLTTSLTTVVGVPISTSAVSATTTMANISVTTGPALREGSLLQFSFVVQNIDYLKLVQNSTLQAAFSTSLKSVIATELDNPGHLAFSLSAGSVVVHVNISIGSLVTSTQLQMRVIAKTASLSQTLAKTFAEIPGIDRISQGAISVVNVTLPILLPERVITLPGTLITTTALPTMTVLTTTASARKTASVNFSLVVQNVSYVLLTSNDTLEKIFIHNLKASIAKELGGLDLESITLSLSAGSVVVWVAIRMFVIDHANRVSDFLTNQKHALSQAVAQSVASTPGIEAASSGAISVSNVTDGNVSFSASPNMTKVNASTATFSTTSYLVLTDEKLLISFSVIVENVDYHQLTANATLEAAFRTSATSAIVGQFDGLVPENVSLSLSAGSVILQVDIGMDGSGKPPDQIRSALRSSWANLSIRIREAINKSVTEMPSIASVLVSPIVVSNISLPEVKSINHFGSTSGIPSTSLFAFTTSTTTSSVAMTRQRTLFRFSMTVENVDYLTLTANNTLHVAFTQKVKAAIVGELDELDAANITLSLSTGSVVMQVNFTLPRHFDEELLRSLWEDDIDERLKEAVTRGVLNISDIRLVSSGLVNVSNVTLPEPVFRTTATRSTNISSQANVRSPIAHKGRALNFTFVVNNLEYSQLVANFTLQEVFETNLQATIASELGGIAPKDVTLSFSAGSTIVQVVVSALGNVDARRLHSIMTSSWEVFRQRLSEALRIRALATAGLEGAASGILSISNMSFPEVVDEDQGTVTTTTSTSLQAELLLSFSLLVQNLDYIQLTANATLLDSFKTNTKLAIARELNLDVNSTRVALSVGSVIVNVSVGLPHHTDSDAMVSWLTLNWKSFKPKLISAISLATLEIPGIEAVSSGAINVSNISAPELIVAKRTFARTTLPSVTQQLYGLRFSFVVDNLGYPQVAENSSLQGALMENLQVAIAESLGGIAPDNVNLTLSAGSTIVQAVIIIPENVDLDDMQSMLRANWQIFNPKLSDALISSVLSTAGIEVAASGVVGISNISFPELVDVYSIASLDTIATTTTSTTSSIVMQKNAVGFSFVVHGIEYDQLEANATLQVAMKTTIKSAMAVEMGGIVADDVVLKLAEGSLTVYAKIKMPDDVKAKEMQSMLSANWSVLSPRLAHAVAQNVSKIPDIARASSGVVSVSNMSLPELADLPVAPTALPTSTTRTTTTIMLQGDSFLRFSFVVRNIDHSQLAFDSALRANFGARVQETIANEMGGLDLENVALTLSAGSVIVQVDIKIPEEVDPGQMQMMLSTNWEIFKPRLVQALTRSVIGTPGIQVASSGVVSVTDMSKPELTYTAGFLTTVLTQSTTRTTTVTTEDLETLKFSFIIMNVNYMDLKRNTTLQDAFMKEVRATVASQFMIDSKIVHVSIAAGSGSVRVEIRMVDHGDPSGISSVLHADWGYVSTMLTQSLAARVTDIPGIGAVSSGIISVGEFSSLEVGPGIVKTARYPVSDSTTMVPVSAFRFSFSIQNLDYTQLAANSTLLMMLEENLQATIAHELDGVVSENIGLSFSAGSTIVQVTVIIPDGANPDAMRLMLSSNWETFRSRLNQAVTRSVLATADVEAISSGTISVSNMTFPELRFESWAKTSATAVDDIAVVKPAAISPNVSHTTLPRPSPQTTATTSAITLNHTTPSNTSTTILTASTTTTATVPVTAPALYGLGFSFVTNNLNYTLLTANSTLQTALERNLQATIASELGGIDPDGVSLIFSTDSTIVRVVLGMPQDVDLNSMESILKSNWHLLSPKLIQAMTRASMGTAGIGAASSGVIGISNMSLPEALWGAQATSNVGTISAFAEARASVSTINGSAALPVATSQGLGFSFVIYNLVYHQLTSRSELLMTLETNLRATVAHEIGHYTALDNIRLSFSAGSVIVHVVIETAEDPALIQSMLHSTWEVFSASFHQAVATAISNTSGIEIASAGACSVGNVSFPKVILGTRAVILRVSRSLATESALASPGQVAALNQMGSSAMESAEKKHAGRLGRNLTLTSTLSERVAVAVVLIVENVEFSKLLADASLLTEVERVLKKSIADDIQSGVGTNDVSVTFSVKSDAVHLRIRLPGPVKASAVGSMLATYWDVLGPRLQTSISDGLSQIRGIDLISRGAVQVKVKNPTILLMHGNQIPGFFDASNSGAVPLSGCQDVCKRLLESLSDICRLEECKACSICLDDTKLNEQVYFQINSV